jgi:hypothetical protein
MGKADFEDRVGAENICPNVEAALNRAKTIYEDGMALKQQFAAAAK